MAKFTVPVAVTGSTGALGGRVARRLAERGVAQRLVVRDAERAPHVAGAELAIAVGYHDREAMRTALQGAQTLFLVSARESPHRVSEHVSAVDAAVDAGVERIVYVSFLNAAPEATFTLARDHYHTEQHIRGTGLAFIFLRDSLYLDLTPSLASPSGTIAGPAGTGRVAFVSRDDVADAAATILASEAHEGRTFDFTGPEAHDLAYVAAQLARVSGRNVSFRNETIEEAYASRARLGAPAFEVEGWVSSYAAIAAGELALVSGDLPALLGRRTMTLTDYLERYPASYRHLLPDRRRATP